MVFGWLQGAPRRCVFAMASRRAGCLLGLMCGLWPASGVLAQAAGTETAAPGEDQDALARRIFALGSRAYEEENFPEAANYFEQAFELSGRAELMYNIGIARERDGQREEAVSWFERYLNELPTGVRVDEVRVRLSVLRQALEEERAANVAPESVARSSTEGSTTESVATENASGGGSTIPGWAMVGTGGALVVGGTVLLILAGSSAGTVEDAPQGTPWAEVEGDYDQAGLFSGLGAVGIGVGSALVAGGLVWVVLSEDESGEENAVDLAVGANSVTLKGSF